MDSTVTFDGMSQLRSMVMAPEVGIWSGLDMRIMSPSEGVFAPVRRGKTWYRELYMCIFCARTIVDL